MIISMFDIVLQFKTEHQGYHYNLKLNISRSVQEKYFYTMKGYYVDIMNLKENVDSFNGDDVFQLLCSFYHR